jgi:hypothetical protein
LVSEPELAREWFHTEADSTAITNRQILFTALITLIVAAGAAKFTRTTTHSAQTLTASVLLYLAMLSMGGLRAHVKAGEWATIALHLIPLFVGTAGIACVLLRRGPRYYQAPPWIYFSAILFLGISYAIALHAFEEWGDLAAAARQPLSFLLLSFFGIIQVVIGLLARRQLAHHCRFATRTVIFLGLVNCLVGLGAAGWSEVWPGNWPALQVFARQIPWPHVILPFAALVITLLACRHQMFAFLLVGLTGLAFSVHVLGHLYFNNVPVWPKILIVAGAIAFFVALFRELRRTRGNVFDDVVTQSRL